MSGGHTVHIQRSANEAVGMSSSLYVAPVSIQSGFNGVAVPFLRSARVLVSKTPPTLYHQAVVSSLPQDL